jgi:hypothetical protein
VKVANHHKSSTVSKQQKHSQWLDWSRQQNQSLQYRFEDHHSSAVRVEQLSIAYAEPNVLG